MNRPARQPCLLAELSAPVAAAAAFCATGRLLHTPVPPFSEAALPEPLLPGLPWLAISWLLPLVPAVLAYGAVHIALGRCGRAEPPGEPAWPKLPASRRWLRGAQLATNALWVLAFLAVASLFLGTDHYAPVEKSRLESWLEILVLFGSFALLALGANVIDRAFAWLGRRRG